MVLERQLVTPAQFNAFVMRPENKDRRFEYIAGEIIEVVSNNYSSQVAAIVLGAVSVFARANKLGRVTGADGGYMVADEKYMPDAAYISYAKQPEACRETWNPIAPDLAIEVISPTDNLNELARKITNYLYAGTTVWVFDPDEQTTDVHKPNHPRQTLGIDGVLDGGDVLPGFTLALRDVFEE